MTTKGWLDDDAAARSPRLEKLKSVAIEVAAEGWKWITVDLELPCSYDYDLRAVTPTSRN